MVHSKPTSVSNSDRLRPRRTTGIYGIGKKKDFFSSSVKVLHTKIEVLHCNCLHPHFVHFIFLPEVLWGWILQHRVKSILVANALLAQRKEMLKVQKIIKAYSYLPIHVAYSSGRRGINKKDLPLSMSIAP